MKHYPPQFKAEAVALYRSRPGATIRSVAEDLGVNPETLRNWIRADDGDALANRFQFVDDHRQRFGVKRLCSR